MTGKVLWHSVLTTVLVQVETDIVDSYFKEWVDIVCFYSGTHTWASPVCSYWASYQAYTVCPPSIPDVHVFPEAQCFHWVLLKCSWTIWVIWGVNPADVDLCKSLNDVVAVWVICMCSWRKIRNSVRTNPVDVDLDFLHNGFHLQTHWDSGRLKHPSSAI